MKRITLKELFTSHASYLGSEVNIKGWVRSVRKSKAFSFVVVSDGSCQDLLQIIIDEGIKGYDELSSMIAGTCVSINGNIVESKGKGQTIEMQGTHGEIIGPVDESYPLQKKGTSLEHLREIAHLRARTNLFGAVFRVRHELAQATHRFFSDKGFFYLNSPIITNVDGEGAGEMFNVSTVSKHGFKKDDKGEIDFSNDYFGKETSLCVTGQLEAECHALGLGAVYTFGPTFRSENSNTKRHLAEFWMIEPELAFADLDDVAELAADYIKYLIDHSLKHCEKELKFIHSLPFTEVEKNYSETLKSVVTSEFKKITYTKAIDILNASGEKFEFPTNWGDELQTEHERYLTDKHFKSPVIVTDYPKDFKAFYMKQNDDGKTVRAMDVLVPGIGELIGGSQREESLDKLTQRMKELDMDLDNYWWYLELRKFGSAPHGGFGLGFERAIMYITGMSNIRDVIAFPRTPGNCDF